ncbi:conserved hypothetical protein [Leishmania major strain Friedlin]|uniref:Uncharacterized protein n=1 Tax=Leishmania major TaxID=5664 RepID=Q4QGW8_LEIMA|nr:conserved hypothetical protein [Leishmania major strain Friedlin]CAG9570287.1 hypothetical_protein_-_conserved [Leishmania major strain Friedlin]CAJ02969.1 conserved hypothetical protein [Leishmania major strain Friedlin]|eukprot:XP_001681580.1 conserved hypothetical protein [Leishmania major strain Friedlin]
MMPLTLVDAYALALRTLDPAAWELFCALEDRILHSAAFLLGRVELTALRPAVKDSAAALSPTAASCVQPTVTSGVHDAEAMGIASVAAEMHRHLRETLRAGALHTFQSRPDSPTTSASARLVKDLSRVRQQVASALSPSSSPRCPGLVLAELSIVCQTVLALSALWMSTKFWATLCESTTLSALIACFLRLSSPPSKDETVAASCLERGTVGSVASAERGPCTDDAPDVVPMELANADQLCLASTPPSSFLAPVPLGHRSCAETCSAQVGAAGGLEGGAACVSSEIIINGYEDISCSPLAPMMWLDGSAADAAESLARDIEDVEIILLRCSEYAVPV